MALTEENKKDFFDEITDKVIKAMEDGDKEWKRTWDKLGTSNPYNPLTGTEYSGINKIALSFAGHSDPRFMTFKQASDMGYKIQKGSKSHSIIHFQMNEKEVENEKTGEKEIVKIPSVKTFAVFNAEQIVGIPRLTIQDAETKKFDEIKNVEELIKNSGVVLMHGGNQPLYSPKEDLIRMPLKEQFHTPIDYYSTLLHEMTHWTGHETRLDRLKQGGFASKSYAHEELVAELGSVFLSSKSGIPLNDDHFKHHSQYLNGWISILKDDKKALYKAASQAEKATDFVMQYSPEQSNKVEMIKGNKEQEQTKPFSQPKPKTESLSL
jgi:antirestriction protein ArdC